MSETDIVVVPEEAPLELYAFQQAKALYASGTLPPQVNSWQKAFAIIQMGRELGIGPMNALNNINVINGKPTINAQLMLALVRKHPDVVSVAVAGDDDRATCTIVRKGNAPHSETFTIQDATALGLTNRDQWKKQRRTMLKWRAISACCRVAAPDVITGLYTEDEMAPDTIGTERRLYGAYPVEQLEAPGEVDATAAKANIAALFAKVGQTNETEPVDGEFTEQKVEA